MFGGDVITKLLGCQELSLRSEVVLGLREPEQMAPPFPAQQAANGAGGLASQAELPVEWIMLAGGAKDCRPDTWYSSH